MSTFYKRQFLSMPPNNYAEILGGGEVIVDVGTYALPKLLVGVSHADHVITSAWSPTIRW